MAAKNTYTLRIKYDNGLRGRFNEKFTFKAMVDDQNNWKSLDRRPGAARREKIELALLDCKRIGEEFGDAMMKPQQFWWYPARFAEAVSQSFRGTEMLSFTGEEYTSHAPETENGVVIHY